MTTAEKRKRAMKAKPKTDPNSRQLGNMSGKVGESGKNKRDWYSTFLNALRDKPNPTYAAKKAMVDLRLAYYHRDTNPDFAEDWKFAIEEGRDNIELKMVQAAENGNVRAQEYLLTKWRYGSEPRGRKPKEKAEEPKVLTVAWGENK